MPRAFSSVRRVLIGVAVSLMCLAPAGAAPVDDGTAGFDTYRATLRARAVAAGVRTATIDTALAGLSLDPRVVALDRAQPGADPRSNPPFGPYRAAHVDPVRIARGRSILAANAARPDRSGVPLAIAVSIWGNETSYGAVTGRFDLLRSLATLAYDGRRRSLFEGEFVDALRMLDRGVPRARLIGSWAGATGNPQFLPSAYLRFGRDGDGDGRIDIWSGSADTLASIADYFAETGWRTGEPWGMAVVVPAMLDRASVATRLVSPRCPRVFARYSAWRTMAEWRSLGVVPTARGWPDDGVQATLFEPDGPGGAAFLLTGNYRVILDYNCSNFYALAVGLLADAIEGQAP